MKDKLQIFSFNGQRVRIVDDSRESWFCVRDIGAILGLTKASENVRKILRSEELHTYSIGTNGVGSPKRHMVFTNESGLYTLIMRSRRDEAVNFRVWVTNEVLPSIRKTGSYHSAGTDEVHPATLTMSGNVTSGELSFTYSAVFSGNINPERFSELRGRIEELVSVVRETYGVEQTALNG